MAASLQVILNIRVVLYFLFFKWLHRVNSKYYRDLRVPPTQKVTRHREQQ